MKRSANIAINFLLSGALVILILNVAVWLAELVKGSENFTLWSALILVLALLLATSVVVYFLLRIYRTLRAD